MNLAATQALMLDQRIDAWLVYDFRASNQVFARLTPSPTGKRHTTRRIFLLIPARGEPTLLHHAIDTPALADIKLNKESYLSWQQLHAWIASRLASAGRVAMEYSPGNALPVVSIADAGAVDLVRAAGAEVVSSANLIQTCLATWSDEAVRNHARASELVAKAKDDAFALIRDRVRVNRDVTEYEVQQHIVKAFDAAGLEYPDPPIVGANAHSGDPHFEVSAAAPARIKRGDWILIDLWARIKGDDNIYSDITWTGFAGERVPDRHRKVFDAVRDARDASLARAVAAWRAKETVQGWQLDDAAREVIIRAGHEPHIRHRTGHSLSPGPLVHGIGMNLDNLETHDTRAMLPRIGFTIEPGIYMPEQTVAGEGGGGFGVRNEINVYVDPVKGPIVTSCKQDEPILCG